jgi:outer membrane protein assembly factor BamD
LPVVKLRPATGLLPALLLGLTVAACGGGTKDVQVSYLSSAKLNYEKGVQELGGDNFAEARKFFRHVKDKFGFTKYAALSELKLADTDFAEQLYSAAIDGYRTFIKFHPTHEQVEDGYAAWRIGLCYVKQMPTDWFLIPPSYEKDQTSVREAARELARFIKAYPKTQFTEEAARYEKLARRRLAAHEFYVADFYLSRGKYKAAAVRLEGILDDYAGANDPKALFELGQAYLGLKEPKTARKHFAKVVDKFPGDHHAPKARRYLDFIDKGLR